jgi:hypothetical protein
VGLYVNDESINKQFLKKHFDEKSGPLFKCDDINRFCDTANAPSAMPANLYYMGDDTTLYYDSYDMKSEQGWEELVNLVKVIDLDFQNIDSVLNVDRTLWAFAVNQVIQNLDCYNTYYIHNYYLYQAKDGLFQMIPWDLDNSFSGAIMGFDYWSQSNIYEYDPYFAGPSLGGSTQPWDERPLLYKLLNNNHYRKIYTAHINTIIEESLDTSAIKANIDNLQALAYNAASQDYNKAFSMSDYYSNVDDPLWTGWGFGGILSTINERKQFLLNHPEISLVSPTIDNIMLNDNLITAEVFNANTVELLATTSEYNSKFQSFLKSSFDIYENMINNSVYRDSSKIEEIRNDKYHLINTIVDGLIINTLDSIIGYQLNFDDYKTESFIQAKNFHKNNLDLVVPDELLESSIRKLLIADLIDASVMHDFWLEEKVKELESKKNRTLEILTIIDKLLKKIN